MIADGFIQLLPIHGSHVLTSSFGLTDLAAPKKKSYFGRD
jgi:hypothetical protein